MPNFHRIIGKTVEAYYMRVSTLMGCEAMDQLNEINQKRGLPDDEVYKIALDILTRDKMDGEAKKALKYFHQIVGRSAADRLPSFQRAPETTDLSDHAKQVVTYAEKEKEKIISEINAGDNPKQKAALCLFEDTCIITCAPYIGFDDEDEATVDVQACREIGDAELSQFLLTDKGFIYDRNGLNSWMKRGRSGSFVDPRSNTTSEINGCIVLSSKQVDVDLLNKLVALEKMKRRPDRVSEEAFSDLQATPTPVESSEGRPAVQRLVSSLWVDKPKEIRALEDCFLDCYKKVSEAEQPGCVVL